MAYVAVGVAVGAALYSGYQSYQAGKDSKELSENKADLQKKESELAIEQTIRDEASFLGSQETAFAKSGVLLEGTPLAVLDATRKEFQRQRQAIEETGSAQVLATLQQGKMAFNQGLAGAAQGVGSAASVASSGYVKKQQFNSLKTKG